MSACSAYTRFVAFRASPYPCTTAIGDGFGWSESNRRHLIDRGSSYTAGNPSFSAINRFAIVQNIVVSDLVLFTSVLYKSLFYFSGACTSILLRGLMPTRHVAYVRRAPPSRQPNRIVIPSPSTGRELELADS